MRVRVRFAQKLCHFVMPCAYIVGVAVGEIDFVEKLPGENIAGISVTCRNIAQILLCFLNAARVCEEISRIFKITVRIFHIKGVVFPCGIRSAVVKHSVVIKNHYGVYFVFFHNFHQIVKPCGAV